MLHRIVIGSVCLLTFATATARAQAASAPPAGVSTILRSLVLDSLFEAGRRNDETYYAADDSTAIDVTKRCHFTLRGKASGRGGFVEQVVWETRLVEGHWRIVRSRWQRVT